VFVPAEATIAGEKILVSASYVPQPMAVRYGWSKTPDVNLFNQASLPARANGMFLSSTSKWGQVSHFNKLGLTLLPHFIFRRAIPMV